MYTEHYCFLVIVFMRQLCLHVSYTSIFFFISISVLKTVNFGNGAELKLNDLVKEIQVLEMEFGTNYLLFFIIRCRP